MRGDAVEVRVKDTDLGAALPKLRELSQPLGGLLGSSGQRSLEVSDAGGGLIRLTVPQAAITRLRDPGAADKARGFVQGLGGVKNILRVEAVAETRLRVMVGNEKNVNESDLRAAGVDGIMRLPNQILHLIVGPNADQYAAEMAGQIA